MRKEEKQLKNSKLQVYKDDRGLFGYKNPDTEKIVVKAQYEKAFQFSEGLAAVCINDVTDHEYPQKWGYINEEGQLVIPFNFAEAHPFSDGKAKVTYLPEIVPVKPAQDAQHYVDTSGCALLVYQDLPRVIRPLSLDYEYFGFAMEGKRLDGLYVFVDKEEDVNNIKELVDQALKQRLAGVVISGEQLENYKAGRWKIKIIEDAFPSFLSFPEYLKKKIQQYIKEIHDHDFKDDYFVVAPKEENEESSFCRAIAFFDHGIHISNFLFGDVVGKLALKNTIEGFATKLWISDETKLLIKETLVQFPKFNQDFLGSGIKPFEIILPEKSMIEREDGFKLEAPLFRRQEAISNTIRLAMNKMGYYNIKFRYVPAANYPFHFPENEVKPWSFLINTFM